MIKGLEKPGCFRMRWAVLDPAPHDTKGQLYMNIVSEFIIGGMSYVKADTRYSRHLHVYHLTHTFSLPPTSPIQAYMPGTWHTHLCQQRAAESGNWRWGIYWDCYGLSEGVRWLFCSREEAGAPTQNRGQVEMHSWHMAHQHSSHKDWDFIYLCLRLKAWLSVTD